MLADTERLDPIEALQAQRWRAHGTIGTHGGPKCPWARIRKRIGGKLDGLNACLSCEEILRAVVAVGFERNARNNIRTVETVHEQRIEVVLRSVCKAARIAENATELPASNQVRSPAAGVQMLLARTEGQFIGRQDSDVVRMVKVGRTVLRLGIICIHSVRGVRT